MNIRRRLYDCCCTAVCCKYGYGGGRPSVALPTETMVLRSGPLVVDSYPYGHASSILFHVLPCANIVRNI